jgi:hypothetical protein
MLSTKFEDYLDREIYEEGVEALEVVLYIMEQHLLEDGVRGKDKLQDALGDAWHSLRKAYELTLRKHLNSVQEGL